ERPHMSWDTFLGGPFNIAEGGLLLELVSRLTGFKPKRVTIFSGDTHVFENHLPMVEEQLSRTPLGPPQLDINDRIPYFNTALTRFKDERGEEFHAGWIFPSPRTEGTHGCLIKENIMVVIASGVKQGIK